MSTRCVYTVYALRIVSYFSKNIKKVASRKNKNGSLKYSRKRSCSASYI